MSQAVVHLCHRLVPCGARRRAGRRTGEVTNRFLREIEVSAHLERGKPWSPDHCIRCPRKQAQIANDRCLEYQVSDGCSCPARATESVRLGLELAALGVRRPGKAVLPC